MTSVRTGFSRLIFVAVLGVALLWLWWRRRLVSLWRQPQHAPLSAQWLNAG
ncbi:MAG: hypothetical protein HPY64_00940 [Anaerolineae bacterium]|nr:hypothetical protein [Anaerolineae bacterium]